MTDRSYTNITENNETFQVRKDMLEAEPELVHLIATHEGLKIEPYTRIFDGQPIDGRQYWLTLYPIISRVRQKKLRKILYNEATKLHLIDLKFGQVSF